MTRGLTLVLAVLLLAACTPVIQQADRPSAGFAGPRFEGDRFISFDGAPLGLTTWPVAGGEPWAVIVGLHGMNDYAGTFRLAGPYWARHGITTYAYDQRGYGRSPNRGVWPGEDLMDQDLRTAVNLARARHPGAIIAVVGHSMGSAAAISAFASSRPPKADRLVVTAPAVWGWSSQPLPQKLSAWVAGRTIRSAVVEPPRIVTKKIRASDNIDMLREIGRDPNMLWGTRMDAIYGIVDLMEHAWSGTGRIQAPTAYLYGRHDDIIPAEPSFEAASRLKRGDRTAYYRDGYHMLLVDKQAERVFADIEAFIRDPNAAWPSQAPAIPKPAKKTLVKLPSQHDAAVVSAPG